MAFILRVLIAVVISMLSLQVTGEVWRVHDKSSFKTAFKKVKDGDYILLAKGEYALSAVLKAHNVTIQAEKGAVLAGKAAKGKAALVLTGDGTKIVNLECHSIEVRDGNGACIRLEGRSVYLKNVYFHDSQQGLLSSRKTELIQIDSSRFERLGYGGKAHGIYAASRNAQLIIRNSKFLSSKGEGHEIKSRGFRTVIENSLIASLDGNDSRLVDVPNGGELVIRNSILQQGKVSSNTDMIGFGLEGRKFMHNYNQVTLVKNIFLLDRSINRLLHFKEGKKYQTKASKNMIVGSAIDELPGFNFMFDSRKEAGLQPYPYIPDIMLQQ